MDERSLWEKFDDLMTSGNDRDLATFMAVMFIVIAIICSVIGAIYITVNGGW